MYNKNREEKENRINNNFMFILAIFFSLFPHQAFAQPTGEGCSSDSTAAKLVCNFGTLIDVAVIFGYVLAGILFFVAGLYVYLSQKKPQQYGPGSILGALIAASLFLGFSNVITIYQNFIFDDGNIYELHQYNESLQRISGTETGGFSYMSSESMQAILAFVKLVGVVAMLKSIYLIYDAGRGNDPHKSIYFQIMIYAVGGAMAFRIEDISCVIGDFFNIQSICLIG